MKKPVRYFSRLVLAGFCLVSMRPAQAASLTAEEISQIETDLGMTLSTSEQQQIATIVKPDGPLPQWRIDADARIEQHRKANLNITVLDAAGNPVSNATVNVSLHRNSFRFGGVLNLKDFSDEKGNLQITTNRYRELFLKLFNSGGLNNGLKAKLRTSNEPLLPAFFDWAQTNNLPVRGHLLIWPGNLGNNHIPVGEPYDILPKVEAVETALTNSSSQAVIDALNADLKNEVDFLIADWASKWPVYEWDVINEPLGNHRIQDLIGYDQMAEWFRIAESNTVQPDCKLLLNEYQIISGRSETLDPGAYTSRRDRYMAELDRVVTHNGPLHRIGFQSRLQFEHLDPQTYYDRLEEFGSAYGLEMAGTEFDVVDRDPAETGFFPYVYTEEERAQITEEALTAYYSHPLVTGLNAWTYMKDVTSSLCNYDGTVKLNGLVWYYLHRIRYNTDTQLTANASGNVVLSAFKGDYDITVSVNGTNFPATLNLAEDMSLVIYTASPHELYSDWTTNYPALGGATNLTDNPDGDPLNNLCEYALGCDPTIHASDPRLFFQPLEKDGTHYFEYVYSRRNDAAARGLNYQLQQTTNLMTGTWETNGFEWVGSGTLNDEFDSVTNRISMGIKPQQFIRLRVEMP